MTCMENEVGNMHAVLAIEVRDDAETDLQTIMQFINSLEGVRLLPLNEVRDELKDGFKDSVEADVSEN